MPTPGHPPAPWRLVGRAILLPALMEAGSAPRRLRAPGGRSLGGLLLGAYDARSTLAYHELLGVGSIEWRTWTPAARITVAAVDDDSSLAGGRAIWGIPKRLATFDWDESGQRADVTVTDATGELLAVSARARPRARSVPLLAPFAGVDGAACAWVRGWLRGAPARMSVRVPPGSPLAALRPVFSPTGVLGDVWLRVGAPRRAPEQRAWPVGRVAGQLPKDS